MELTRRDALAALAAGGVAVGAGVFEEAWRDDATAAFGAHERETLLAVAGVVYPSALEGVDSFVDAYLRGRTNRPEYAEGAAGAVATLDDHAGAWYGDAFVDLDEPESLLRELGADTAEPDPDGSPAERVRYYLVNELLFALYASPTGGELVGIENPQGHPGGTTSYRRGPHA
jgi:hypothetical protein